MRLHALLSFYNEAPADLDRLIRSLPLAGVDTLVALDGAYGLYPDAKASSPEDNHAAIRQACDDVQLDHMLIVPPEPWHGNETEKRTALFGRADHKAQPGDWYMIVDGDEVIEECPPDLKAQLAATPFDVGEVIFREPRPGRKNAKRFPIPILFRAIPGIQVVGNHYTYRTPDGRNLWGNASTHRLEARHPLHDLVIGHFRYYRGRGRRAARQRRTTARGYYKTRERAQVELGKCARCPRKATTSAHGNWRPDGPGRLVGEHVEVCAACLLTLKAEQATAFAIHGVPQDAKVQHALGAAP